jgi:hypothetical protein
LQESLQALQTEQESETAAIEAEWHERRASLGERAQQERENKEREFEERKWELNTEYEAAASDLEERSRKLELKLQEQWARIKAIREEARQLLQVWRQPVEKVVAVRPKFTKDDDLLAIVQAKTDLAREYLESLKTLVLPRCLEGKRPWWLATFLAVLLAPLFLIGYAVLIAGQSVGSCRQARFGPNMLCPLW